MIPRLFILKSVIPFAKLTKFGIVITPSTIKVKVNPDNHPSWVKSSAVKENAKWTISSGQIVRNLKAGNDVVINGVEKNSAYYEKLAIKYNAEAIKIR